MKSLSFGSSGISSLEDVDATVYCSTNFASLFGCVRLGLVLHLISVFFGLGLGLAVTFLFLLALLLISDGHNDQSGFTLLAVSDDSLSESMSVGSVFPLEDFLADFSSTSLLHLCKSCSGFSVS